MKFFFVLVFTISSGISCFTQIIQDTASFHTGLQMIDHAQTEDQYMEAAEFFEHMVGEDETNWLVHYYAGLSYTLASYENPNTKARDLLIDCAQEYVDKALTIQTDEPELIVLQAMVLQARIQVNPELRGLTYSMKVNSLLKKVIQETPDNPRAQLLLAFNTYYSPAIVGGGPVNALPLFIRAMDLFSTFNPESEFLPRWGKEETLEMIDTCRQETGKP